MIDRANQCANAIGDVRSGPAGSAGTAFVDLVCADPVLLQIEFDAIIAANYPASAGTRDRRPPRRAVPATTGRPALPSAARPARDHSSVTGPGGSRHPRARQRGPPVSPDAGARPGIQYENTNR